MYELVQTQKKQLSLHIPKKKTALLLWFPPQYPGICLPLQVDYSDNVQRDLLDALLRAKRSSENNNTSTHDVGLTEDHVLMTVGDIFGAGVETTTTVLKWSIAYLVHNPQVNKLLRTGFPNQNFLAMKPDVLYTDNRCRERFTRSWTIRLEKTDTLNSVTGGICLI